MQAETVSAIKRGAHVIYSDIMNRRVPGIVAGRSRNRSFYLVQDETNGGIETIHYSDIVAAW